MFAVAIYVLAFHCFNIFEHKKLPVYRASYTPAVQKIMIQFLLSCLILLSYFIFLFFFRMFRQLLIKFSQFF